MKKYQSFVVWMLIALSLSCVTFAKPTEIDYLIPEGFSSGVTIDIITPAMS